MHRSIANSPQSQFIHCRDSELRKTMKYQSLDAGVKKNSPRRVSAPAFNKYLSEPLKEGKETTSIKDLSKVEGLKVFAALAQDGRADAEDEKELFKKTKTKDRRKTAGGNMSTLLDVSIDDWSGSDDDEDDGNKRRSRRSNHSRSKSREEESSSSRRKSRKSKNVGSGSWESKDEDDEGDGKRKHKSKSKGRSIKREDSKKEVHSPKKSNSRKSKKGETDSPGKNTNTPPTSRRRRNTRPLDLKVEEDDKKRNGRVRRSKTDPALNSKRTIRPKSNSEEKAEMDWEKLAGMKSSTKKGRRDKRKEDTDQQSSLTRSTSRRKQEDMDVDTSTEASASRHLKSYSRREEEDTDESGRSYIAGAGRGREKDANSSMELSGSRHRRSISKSRNRDRSLSKSRNRSLSKSRNRRRSVSRRRDDKDMENSTKSQSRRRSLSRRRKQKMDLASERRSSQRELSGGASEVSKNSDNSQRRNRRTTLASLNSPNEVSSSNRSQRGRRSLAVGGHQLMQAVQQEPNQLPSLRKAPRDDSGVEENGDGDNSQHGKETMPKTLSEDDSRKSTATDDTEVAESPSTQQISVNNNDGMPQKNTLEQSSASSPNTSVDDRLASVLSKTRTMAEASRSAHVRSISIEGDQDLDIKTSEHAEISTQLPSLYQPNRTRADMAFRRSLELPGSTLSRRDALARSYSSGSLLSDEGSRAPSALSMDPFERAPPYRGSRHGLGELKDDPLSTSCHEQRKRPLQHKTDVLSSSSSRGTSQRRPLYQPPKAKDDELSSSSFHGTLRKAFFPFKTTKNPTGAQEQKEESLSSSLHGTLRKSWLTLRKQVSSKELSANEPPEKAEPEAAPQAMESALELDPSASSGFVLPMVQGGTSKVSRKSKLPKKSSSPPQASLYHDERFSDLYDPDSDEEDDFAY